MSSTDQSVQVDHLRIWRRQMSQEMRASRLSPSQTVLLS